MKISYKLPDFLIVGAAKSGTSSLWYYLKQHPQIFMPEIKEPWFFAYANDPPNFSYPKRLNKIITQFDDYIKLFVKLKSNQIAGEASPVYLFLYEKSIHNIKKYIPHWRNLKIIIILRNPIERAYSNYLHHVKVGVEHLPFEEAIKKEEERERNNCGIGFQYVKFSFYYKMVEAYLENFRYVRVYLFEDLKQNPLKLIKNLFTFLNVDSNFIPKDIRKYNVSGIPRNKMSSIIISFLAKPNLFKDIIKVVSPLSSLQKLKSNLEAKFLIKPEMDKQVKKLLIDIYKDDIIKLQYLIQRNLRHWLM